MFGSAMFQAVPVDGGNETPTTPVPGATGLSAYELAVQNGFSGTLAQWFESLHGEPGEKGIDGESPTPATIAGLVQQQMPTREALIELLVEQLPTNEQLRALIAPMIPAPLKGEDGHSPTAQELRELITPLIPAPVPGPSGLQGASGPAPSHEELVALITPLIPPPVPGPAGTNGASAFQLAVINGYTGSVTEWLDSLRGPQGAKGDSITGPAGPQGPKGDSVAGPQGIQGVKGEKGDTVVGPAGPQGLSITGPAGPSGKVALGLFTFKHTALIALGAGIRSLALTPSTNGLSAADIATLNKIVAGDDLLAFPVSALPATYAIHNVVATGAGNITIYYTGPALAIGASFNIPIRLVALR